MRRNREWSVDRLAEALAEIRSASYDGRVRLVRDSDQVKADGELWGIVSDHGNVEICHKGQNGRLYYHGGLV